VGHPRSYTAIDAVARKHRMQGENVLYPIGWDAFGLPTENFAIKFKIKPQEATKKNIANFTRQIKMLGLGFDWSREIDTTDPAYYKWTQWQFLKFYQSWYDESARRAKPIETLPIPAGIKGKGDAAIRAYQDQYRMAYKAASTINWCPRCKIGLANEEAAGGTCERCGHSVEKREKEQWMIRITKYADRLLDDLDQVDYLEKIKAQQIDWIGKSEGAYIDFRVQSASKTHPIDDRVTVFTTRPDTLFGATYLVLAPEHPYVDTWLKDGVITNEKNVLAYRKTAAKQTEQERLAEEKEKTGVVLGGVFAVNPATQEQIPVWIADYVLGGYGTGAIMAVPAHDERDFAFAKKYELPIKEVVAKKFGEVRSDDVRRDGVAAVIIKNNKVLVLHDEKYDIYRLPAGGYEAKESAEEVLKREIQEETGYKNVEIGNYLGQIEASFDLIFAKGRRHKFQKGFQVKLIDEEKGEMDQEGKTIFVSEWFAKDEALKKFAMNKESWGEEEFIRRAFDEKELCFSGEGTVVNSDFLNGLSTSAAKAKITDWLEKNKIGERAVTYKLRDWVFSRQRYWGEPIPLVHCKTCGYVPVPEKELPVLLPDVDAYEPTDTGESPLAKISSWVKTTCPSCGGKAERETDTMPNWAGSSWYFIRYTDPHNEHALASAEQMRYWLPVDLYNGGMEHTTLHLLYSRFWYKFLWDLGIVPNACGSEPYRARRSHGLVLAAGGEKMSKSKGNVINPDEVVKEYGADVFRVYELFMGPFDQAVPWDTNGIEGVRRFLDRVWHVFQKTEGQKNETSGQNAEFKTDLETLYHQTVKKISEGIDALQFNTCISALMILTNAFQDAGFIPEPFRDGFLQMLAAFAPHLAEELWHEIGHTNSIHRSGWPAYDPGKLQTASFELVVQINGKVRDRFPVSAEISEEEAKIRVLSSPQVQKWLEGKTPKKMVYVKGKIMSLVVE
ncbi:MAG TPA: class I tRNA ligase family protein, partial [Patescibacteria group bacterium]|nr:class I tRNA ligase family protein [Patescibacteria group bacterium]